MKIIIIILVSIIILGLLGIYYKNKYNRMQEAKIKVDEAEKIINTHLNNRFDYIVKVAHLVKKKLNLDIELFKELENLKDKKVANNQLDQKIKDAYSTIIQLNEDYPKLSKNKEFKDIIQSFNESNEIFEATKSFYDKYAAVLNEYLSSFPSNIIGRIHGIKRKEYYNTEINTEITD